MVSSHTGVRCAMVIRRVGKWRSGGNSLTIRTWSVYALTGTENLWS